MKKLMIALTAASVAIPAFTAPAVAQDWRRTHDWRRAHMYDYNTVEPGYSTYYADRYYRPSNNYYVMTRDDRIYRGHDGRFYCRRHDGSTGLIVGAALGGLLGNSVGRGDSRAISTIIGAGAGAAIGSSVDRGRVRCR